MMRGICFGLVVVAAVALTLVTSQSSSGNKMANEYLDAKWKLWYKFLDVNHDGKISIEDVEKSRSMFSDLHNLGTVKAKTVEDDFTDWWKRFVFRGRTGEIEEAEFIDSLNKDFTTDKPNFIKRMTICFNNFFEVIDSNKDRSISEEEFLIAFKAYGHEHVVADTKFFPAYNPKDGLVSLGRIIDSWIEFVTSEDASKGSIVKAAFESVV